MQLLKKVFGSRNQRLLRGYGKTVKEINGLESSMEALSDAELKQKTEELRLKLAAGATVADILAPAFAVVREAARRTLGMRHFDVQLIGGMVLHFGKVAEMRTGEGKTLVATLPAYLNALSGKGVHVITVNDYLASRDANWMRPVYEFLGLTVGVNLTTMTHEEKQAAYRADITYGTNNEFGFDYLRDNMVSSIEECVQRPLNFSIIDEVDSILIDEARTPLIISGQAEDSSAMYMKIDSVIPNLKLQTVVQDFNPLDGYSEIADEDRGDYTLDEKNRTAQLTELGHKKVEELLVKMGLVEAGDNVYSFKNIFLMHFVIAALRAHTLFKRDVEYVVKEGQVIIVDEHTGRLMDGRRWSDGLHQAVEAKEKVDIQLENQTLASITFQNYFRLYQKLSGMTGTADTEAFELQKIYALEVVVIPTNKPMIRDDRQDLVFIDVKSKFDAILEEIKECSVKQQPVLVGTASIETSELLSEFLKKSGVKHEVLNAKQHQREANIIIQAGRPGAVTIATNMAGRGTDIVLGGNLDAELEELTESERGSNKEHRIREDWKQRHQKVLDAGGLHVLGTERHESRRIDNQLRGRSGRQGDPGSSQFYLSIEDNLLRIFGADRMQGLLSKLGLKEGESIQHAWINKSVEKAQRKVEGHNYDIRKHLLEFDDVANDQRKVIYLQRRDLLEAEAELIASTAQKLRPEVILDKVHEYIPPETLEEQWDVPGLEAQIKKDFLLQLPVRSWLQQDGDMNAEEVADKITEQVEKAYTDKTKDAEPESLHLMEKQIMLQILDAQWKDHLSAMDNLRQGIGLRAHAQKNPIQEYKRESFEMFQELLDNVKYEFISMLSQVDLQPEEEVAAPKPMQLNYQHAAPGGESRNDANQAPNATVKRDSPKVGRNEVCPCGSGKKYKRCHGQIA
jgi:preprotein translocase subunit SecA